VGQVPAKKMRSIRRPKVYEALKGKYGKTRAAKIANAKGGGRRSKR
jgi:hypothetical protein